LSEHRVATDASARRRGSRRLAAGAPVQAFDRGTSAPTATFDHRWNDDTYAILREDVHRYWDLIHEAFNAAGPDASRALGQDIFGTRFRTPNLSRTPVASERSRRSRVGPAAPDDPPAFRPNRPFSRPPRSPNSATSPQPAGRRWTRVTKIGTVGTDQH
jgi:hypothetical protein